VPFRQVRVFLYALISTFLHSIRSKLVSVPRAGGSRACRREKVVTETVQVPHVVWVDGVRIVVEERAYATLGGANTSARDVQVTGGESCTGKNEFREARQSMLHLVDPTLKSTNILVRVELLRDCRSAWVGSSGRDGCADVK